MYMAEPQNLRVRQFEGKKTNKNKKQGQFFMLFLIILQAKKNYENWTTFGFLWILSPKKGKIQKWSDFYV